MFPFARLLAVRGALCSDGKRRTARVTGEPDTFFSLPARVKVRGRTVTGFLTVDRSDPSVREWRFHANRFGKNGHLLP